MALTFYVLKAMPTKYSVLLNLYYLGFLQVLVKTPFKVMDCVTCSTTTKPFDANWSVILDFRIVDSGE